MTSSSLWLLLHRWSGIFHSQVVTTPCFLIISLYFHHPIWCRVLNELIINWRISFILWIHYLPIKALYRVWVFKMMKLVSTMAPSIETRRRMVPTNMVVLLWILLIYFLWNMSLGSIPTSNNVDKYNRSGELPLSINTFCTS